MARTLDGTSAKITLGIGGLNATFGALSMAAICRITDTTVSRRLIAIGTATTGTARYGFGFTSTGTTIDFRRGNNAGSPPTITMATADGWVLVAVTIAAGTATPRYHKYVFSTNTWTHENGAATLADGTAAATSAYIGATNGGAASFWQGDVEIEGVWNANLTDAQVEALAFSLQAWFAPAQPRGLWLLDQGATAQKVLDLAGLGANESAITGTTVSTQSVPLFNRFDDAIVVTRQASGTSHVTTSWDSSYAVNDHATAVWQSSYVTRARVNATWGSSYTVRDRVTTGWQTSYGVADHVTSTWQSSYVAVDHASASWTSSYLVRDRVSTSWASSYGVADRVTVTWASSYTVRDRVTTAWASSYTARDRVTTTWQSAYGVADRVLTAWASSYVVQVTGLSHLTATWASSYTVRDRAAASWASSYVTRVRLSTGWASSYTVRAPVTVSWVSSWTTRRRDTTGWASSYLVVDETFTVLATVPPGDVARSRTGHATNPATGHGTGPSTGHGAGPRPGHAHGARAGSARKTGVSF